MNQGEDVILLDEELKPPIEKDEEVAILGCNKEWLFVYDINRFVNNLARNFNLNFVSSNPQPSKEMGEKISKISKGSDLSFTMIFRNSNSLTSIECGVLPEYVQVKTDKGYIGISGWPIKRKMYAVQSGREEEVDLLEAFSKNPGVLTREETLKRVNKYFVSEWNKLHGNKKPVYVR